VARRPPAKDSNTITWLFPVPLDFSAALTDEERFLRTLRAQLREEIKKQGWRLGDLIRCVYVIRMTGQFIVAYRKGNSPVLYVGRGGAGHRLASHLKNWLSEVHDFGQAVQVEIRICMPRRRKREGFFKNVEADLIARFLRKYGSVPFFNRRKETLFAGRVQYKQGDQHGSEPMNRCRLRQSPRWAIKPTPANKNLASYLAGTDPE